MPPIRRPRPHHRLAHDQPASDASAQAVKHYEIARYGTLRTWAEELGMRDAAMLLNETLQEEIKTDQLLTKLATSVVNQKAA
jgi:ferritin-like metal-binding protein YciE